MSKQVQRYKQYRLQVLKPAQKDLSQIAHIRMQLVGPFAARKITDSIYDSLERLTTFPYLGASCREKMPELAGYRFIICEKYLCFYKVEGDTIFVHRILDGRSDYPSHMRDYEETNAESEA